MEFIQDHHLETFQVSSLEMHVGVGRVYVDNTHRPPCFPMKLCYCFPRTITPIISGNYLVLGQVGLTG